MVLNGVTKKQKLKVSFYFLIMYLCVYLCMDIYMWVKVSAEVRAKY